MPRVRGRFDHNDDVTAPPQFAEGEFTFLYTILFYKCAKIAEAALPLPSLRREAMKPECVQDGINGHMKPNDGDDIVRRDTETIGYAI